MESWSQAFASVMQADGKAMVMVDEDNLPCVILGCLKSFLPSISPRLIDAPRKKIKKSVRFQLDRNTTHIITPWFKINGVEYESMFITDKEIHEAQLDMQASAFFFRRLYRLERFPNDDDRDIADTLFTIFQSLDEVTTIGLESLIWSDLRWKKRMRKIINLQWRFDANCLAYKSQVSSKPSKKEARERAAWVIHELKSLPTTAEGQPEVDMDLLVQKDMLMNTKEVALTVPPTGSIPNEIYLPVEALCTTPAA